MPRNNIFFLEIVQTKALAFCNIQKVWLRSTLDWWMQINMGQARSPFAIGKHLRVPLAGPCVKFDSIFFCQHWGNSSKEQLKDILPIVKNHTSLDDRTTSFDKTKFAGETIKQVFWQTSINDQRLKLKTQINGKETESLVDIGEDVTIIATKSWDPNWPLQEVNFSF